ncbi:hypothetical protein SAMN04488569_101418 [Marinilactibacillus piezotolerans]|uniref:Uncharacterized protein n=1 Tax=Marinilactibacillus piezotolerans TaxID=258723 RepID=A0A1I3XG62_9LACT|nr:hypothetical protein [Marinilactibacillus piezotolerans]SFK18329.1 hypothetical protein SAMN04488569_101418 [Marinilactibacillus piezotolerans]
MDWLSSTIGVIVLVILGISGVFLFRFKKELQAAVAEDRSLSEDFTEKWEKRLKWYKVGIISATVLGIIRILL